MKYFFASGSYTTLGSHTYPLSHLAASHDSVRIGSVCRLVQTFAPALAAPRGALARESLLVAGLADTDASVSQRAFSHGRNIEIRLLDGGAEDGG